jgi:DNA phosphorothioation-associated putative methyltransferase
MIGKRVAGDLYLHKKSVRHATTEDRDLINETAQSLSGPEKKWNVVRVGNDNIAFLTYRDFNEDPFPALGKSIRFDLLDGRKSVRDFTRHSNPPILHRKELLVPENFPQREAFTELTSTLDDLGVFYDSHKIGFKQQWQNRLRSHGIAIEGYKAIKQAEPTGVIVERHRTALARYQLSQPIQLLVRHGVLSPSVSFFDYGCGRGDDVETLNAGSIQASGWDPHFAPDNPKNKGDVVNIGFVLNVIEDLDERREALLGAWKLTKKVLSVAVMAPSSASIENAKPYKDGFLTSRNTFQKYYTQEQLRDFISDVSGTDPVAVAPGIFFVFADDIALQEYQINRYERSNLKTTSLAGQRSRPKLTQSVDRLEKALPVLENLSSEIIELGRPIHSDEMPPELSQALQTERVAFNTAQHYCLETLCQREELEAVASQRKEDLILYFAIELFSRHKPYRQLPRRLQQDLKHFWGNYANAQIEARQLLFSIGDKEKIQEAAEDAADDGLGYILPDNQLQFHHTILKQLPLILRCYVACGSILYGDIESADIIKIHMNSGKLTLQIFENFDDPLPVLQRRVKIDMRSQNVRIFDYDDVDRQYLYMKSLYVPEDFDEYEQQSKFDRQVSKIGKFDFSGYGPNASVFDEFLSKNALSIGNFEFLKHTISDVIAPGA